jgi:hypothetical protein
VSVESARNGGQQKGSKRLCGKSFEPEAGKGTGRAQKRCRGGKLTVSRGGLAVISEEESLLTRLPKWIEVTVVPRGTVHHNSARASAPDFKVFHVEQGKTWWTFAVKKPLIYLNLVSANKVRIPNL